MTDECVPVSERAHRLSGSRAAPVFFSFFFPLIFHSHSLPLLMERKAVKEKDLSKRVPDVRLCVCVCVRVYLQFVDKWKVSHLEFLEEEKTAAGKNNHRAANGSVCTAEVGI